MLKLLLTAQRRPGVNPGKTIYVPWEKFLVNNAQRRPGVNPGKTFDFAYPVELKVESLNEGRGLTPAKHSSCKEGEAVVRRSTKAGG